MVGQKAHGRKVKKKCAEIYCKKRGNQGFSLIEVLVAMTILAIVSLFILKTFANSAQINSKARRIENANTAASDISENFKSLSIEQLKDMEGYTYKRFDKNGVELVSTAPVSSTDKYVFNLKDYKGINGEKFNVEVTLDPSQYSDDTDSGEGKVTANNINSVEAYSFDSINSEDNILIRDEIYKWDEWAREALGQSDITNIIKTVTIKTEIAGTGVIDGSVYNQTVSGTVTYSLKDGETILANVEKTLFSTGSKSVVLNAKDGKVTPKNVYIMYLPYDTKSITSVPDETGAYYGSDNINIEYVYPTGAGSAEFGNCNVYLAQQNVKSTNSGVDNYKVYINRKNVSVKVNNGDMVFNNTKGTLNLSYGGDNGKVNIYSNIYKWNEYGAPAGSTVNNGIMQNMAVNGTAALYKMTIKVTLDGKEITSVSTTKIN